MITCQACGSTDVAQRMGKNGRYYLVDTKRPHFCPKRAKNGAKPGKAKRINQPLEEKTQVTEAHELAVAGLMTLRYKVTEARDMLKDIPEGEPAVMVLAALQRKDANA